MRPQVQMKFVQSQQSNPISFMNLTSTHARTEDSGHTQAHTDTHRHTHRHTHTNTHRHTDTHRHTHTPIRRARRIRDTHTHTHTLTHRHTQTHTDTHRHTQTQTQRHKDTHTDTPIHRARLGVRLQATPIIQSRLEAICDIALPDARRHRLSLYLTCASNSSFCKYRSPSFESKHFCSH